MADGGNWEARVEWLRSDSGAMTVEKRQWKSEEMKIGRCEN